MAFVMYIPENDGLTDMSDLSISRGQKIYQTPGPAGPRIQILFCGILFVVTKLKNIQ
jgi:hypothetical protein